MQAIARKVQYLNPDIITFQEIPFDLSYEMTNFVNAFLPGYALARNSGTDGSVRSVIASRFPITRSTKWLDGASLVPFGYTNSPSTFTRDLFEAEIAVLGLPQPLHVFTTHLKATTIFNDYTNASIEAARRAAEAACISNFFVTGFLTTNALRPYILTGDMNEDIFRPATNVYATGYPIQKLVSPPTGLQLTTPTNPVTGQDFTVSIQTTLDARFDYILPCGLLFSNIASSQVFRSDKLAPLPPNLFSNDSRTASDHLPVLMMFNHPYDKPFRLTSIARSNLNVTLQWESVLGQPYRVNTASNLTVWTVLASNLTATGTSYTFSTNVSGNRRFFRVYRVP